MFHTSCISGNREDAKYLSPIISNTILTALDSWAPADYEVAAICEYLFQDFFAGISGYIRLADETLVKWERTDRGFAVPYVLASCEEEADPAAVDFMTGEEITARTINRMKEKMADPKELYTFNLFEEYLLAVLIREKRKLYVLEHGSGDRMELTAEEKLAADRLKAEFGYTADEAANTAVRCFRIHEMPLTGESYRIFLEKGFVSAVQRIADIGGSVDGCGYDDARRIFTDIGMKVPLLLIGTKAGAEERKKAVEEAGGCRKLEQ